MKRWFALLGVGLCVGGLVFGVGVQKASANEAFGYNLPFDSQALEETYANMDNVTVKVMRPHPLRTVQVSGTGWKIDDQTIVTAAHTELYGPIVSVMVKPDNVSPNVQIPVVSVYKDVENDMLYLRVAPTAEFQKEAFARVKALELAKVWGEGQEVISQGYPQAEGYKKTYTWGTLGAPVETISFLDMYVQAGELNIHVTPGFSGAPALNTSGEVIGMVIGNNDEGTRGLVIPYWKLKEGYTAYKELPYEVQDGKVVVKGVVVHRETTP